MRRAGLGTMLMTMAIVISSSPASGAIDPASSSTSFGYVIGGSTVRLFDGDQPETETCTLATGAPATLRKLRSRHDIEGWPNGGRARFWLEKVRETIPP